VTAKKSKESLPVGDRPGSRVTAEARTPPPRRVLTVEGERSSLARDLGDDVRRPPSKPRTMTAADDDDDGASGRDTDTAHLLIQLEAARIALRRTFEDAVATTFGTDPAAA
jgi:hypothetical protein